MDKSKTFLSPGFKHELDKEFAQKTSEANQYVEDKKTDVKEMINEHPFASIGLALIGGAIVGMLISNRRG